MFFSSNKLFGMLSPVPHNRWGQIFAHLIYCCNMNWRVSRYLTTLSIYGRRFGGLKNVTVVSSICVGMFTELVFGVGSKVRGNSAASHRVWEKNAAIVTGDIFGVPLNVCRHRKHLIIIRWSPSMWSWRLAMCHIAYGMDGQTWMDCVVASWLSDCIGQIKWQ